jgi:hypothetical protein
LPYQSVFQNEPTTLEYTPQVLDALEKQLVEELRQLDVLKEDEEFDAFAREDDDICCEIRKKQDILRRVCSLQHIQYTHAMHTPCDCVIKSICGFLSLFARVFQCAMNLNLKLNFSDFAGKLCSHCRITGWG